MGDPKARTMRDVLLDGIITEMETDESIFFLSADLGAPSLDALRSKFGERFINVGIAEQNLISVATGLALEGCTVFAYALAPFVSMRAFEHIRSNLSLASQMRSLNVNILAVGAGFSYDVSGPTHHCLEDLSIMRTLPNMSVFSPSDYSIASLFVPHALKNHVPKYIRLDSKPHTKIYSDLSTVWFGDGFFEHQKGDAICLISTGIPLNLCLALKDHFADKGISLGVIDIFSFSPFNDEAFRSGLGRYTHAITLEESFVGCGGLDAFVGNHILQSRLDVTLHPFGPIKSYVLENADRESLYAHFGMDKESLIGFIDGLITVQNRTNKHAETPVIPA